MFKSSYIIKSGCYISLFFLVQVSPAQADESNIRICGGVAAIENVFLKVKEPFHSKYQINLKTQDTGSDEAILMLEKGECDLATTGLKFEEIEDLIKKSNNSLKEPKKFIPKSIGRDRRLIVLNSANNVKTLNKEQLKAVAIGKIKNWKELGGADQPILTVFISKSPGLFVYWQKNIMDGLDWSKKNTQSVASIQEAKKLIAENPGAWTIVPGSTKIESSDKLQLPEIPVFAVPIYSYTYGEPSEQVKKLYDFIAIEGNKYIQLKWK